MRVLFVYFNRHVRPRTLPSISILETVLKHGGHETKIFDTSFYEKIIDKSGAESLKAGIFRKTKGLNIELKQSDPYTDFVKVIDDFDPELVAFTYYSLNVDLHDLFIGGLKRDFPDIMTICGGPTPSINPEDSLEYPYIDMACCGEGEAVLKELCDRYDSNESIEGIPGLWIRKDGNVVSGGHSGVTDLNSLPTQDWDSYDPCQIYGLFEGSVYRMGHVEFTRGCPYDCTYCGSGSIKQSYVNYGIKKYVRHKTPEKFVEECLALKNKYDLEIFYFVDGTFTSMPKSVLRKLSKLYREKVKCPFIALVHPSTINDEVSRLLKEMGCVHTSIGVESGDPDYRSKVLNRHMSDKQIVSSIQSLRRHGINVTTFNMIGLPGMDRGHIFKTIALNKRANPNSSMATIFMAFPDAELTKAIIKQGLIKKSDIKVSTGFYPTIDIKEMSREEIEGLFRTFSIYIKMPKILYPLIRLFEKDTAFASFMRKMFFIIVDIRRRFHLYTVKRNIRMVLGE